MDSPGFWPLLAARLPALCALLLLCGAAAWSLLVRRHVPDEGHLLARLAVGASVALLLSRAAQLYAQAHAFFGPDPVGVEELGTVMLQTTWGAGWRVQALTALGAVVLATMATRGGPVRWSLLGVGALIAALGEPLTGHAMEDGWWTLPYFLQALHVLGAGLWIGSLSVLVFAVRREPVDHARIRDRVERFSPLALSGAGLLGISGLATAWMYMGEPADLWTSQWGVALLVKLGALGVVAALGYHNWQRVQPALGDPDGTRRLRRAAAVELTVAFVLILVTAVLVALPMPAALRG